MSLSIAFVVGQYPKLSEAFILYAAEALIRSGQDLDIFAVNGVSAGSTTHKVQEFVDCHANVISLARHSTGRERLFHLFPLLKQAIVAHGLQLVPALNPINFGRDALNLRILGILAALPAKKFDIVHCQFGVYGPLILKLIDAGMLSGKLIVHFRGEDISNRKRVASGFYELIFAKADHFIANSEHFRRKAIALGVSPTKISVINSGIDLNEFDYSGPRIPSEHEAIQILFVGRLTPKKGVDIAVRAISLLLSRNQQLHFRIIGDGPLKGYLADLVVTKGLSNHVTFLGEQSHENVKRALRAAHIFVAPSMTGPDGDEDAAVNTLKEALAIGVPVVASRHGGIPELVEDNVTGILVDEADPEALSFGITRLLSIVDRWKEISISGREKLLRDYSIDVTNEKQIELYRRMVNQI